MGNIVEFDKLEKWNKKPEPITHIAEEYTYDVVIVGAGVAGLVAAAKASELGSVVVLEKSHHTATIREGEWAFDSQLQRDAGMTFTREERDKVIYDFMESSHNSMATQANVASFVDHSGDLVDWIAPIIHRDPEITVRAEPSYGRYGISYGLFGFPVQDWFVPVRGYLEENGGEIVFNMPAVQLVQDEDTGRITGVIAQDAEGKSRYVKYNARKGVLLAAGGFGLNPEMMREFFPRSEKFVHEIFYPTHTGDGLIMGMQVGADMDPVAWGDCFLGSAERFGNPDPIKVTQIWTPAFGTLPLLFVDLDGKRFINEKGRLHGLTDHDKVGVLCDIDVCNAILWSPGGMCWSIFDDKIEEKLANTVDNSSTTSRYPNPMCSNRPNIERDVAAGVTIKADTIEELAEKMDVEPATLKASIERYNELARKGRDDDFFKEAQWLQTIEDGPFYACKIAPHPCCTRGGLRIGPTGRVLDTKGHDIPGLWASGLNAGAMFGLNTLLGSVSVTQMFGWLGVQDMHDAL